MARVDDRTKMRRQRFAEQYMEALEKGREQSAQKQHPMVDQQSRLDTLHDVLNRLIKDWALDVTALQVKVTNCLNGFLKSNHPGTKGCHLALSLWCR